MENTSCFDFFTPSRTLKPITSPWVPAIVIVSGWKKCFFLLCFVWFVSAPASSSHSTSVDAWPLSTLHMLQFPISFLCALRALYTVSSTDSSISPRCLSDCAVNVHKSCKSLLGECTSSTKKVKTALHCDQSKNKATAAKLLLFFLYK